MGRSRAPTRTNKEGKIVLGNSERPRMTPNEQCVE